VPLILFPIAGLHPAQTPRRRRPACSGILPSPAVLSLLLRWDVQNKAPWRQVHRAHGCLSAEL